MPHILLVEDNFALRLSLSASLRAAGWEVTAAASAEEGELAAGTRAPDVVVLDWMLPGRSGVALLREWRGAGEDWPVILLTARDAVADRVEGLDAGASDYMVKPFATEELLARVRVQLRGSRVPEQSAELLTLACCTVDLSRQQVQRDGEALALTTKETEVLTYLSARPGKTVEREDLLREIWGYRSAVVTRSVDNAVLRLRAKIEPDPAKPRHVITVFGVGYRFEP